ncbi:MAG: class I SAM-dependent methyltransferase [Lachnospiraceae bacterium]|nr:class I SAM-dependent methyltransferase [Candidatus Equihabitans merdae]
MMAEMLKEEMIGKVHLDYTWYSGKDLYSDGDEMENLILDIVKNEEGYELYHKEYHNWPVMYHLTRKRENICLPMELNEDDEVLEIGAGMGAVTGAVARQVKSVDCIELSRRRSLVNAYRHKDMDNINITVGNFKDIEITKKYDVITLIGVLEYACHYVGGATPYEDFLKKMAENLKPGGRLYIAIENKIGIKYFAGYNEDHLGRPFAGLEGYKDEDFVRTFTKSELIALLEKSGYPIHDFYYPFPDYKLPQVIFDESTIKDAEIEFDEITNYDLPKIDLFAQNRFMANLKGSDERCLFSNSFLVEARREDV